MLFSNFKKTLLNLILTGCVFTLVACEPSTPNLRLDPHDASLDLTKEDYRRTLIKQEEDRFEGGNRYKLSKADSELAIPRMSRLLVTPPPPPVGSSELVSFSVTQDVPLSDVLIELGRIAKIDVEMDNDIEGGIILKVEEKPLKVVLDRICRLGDLRYSYSNGILKFENDRPYIENYRVDYLTNGDLWDAVESTVNSIVSSNKEEDENVSVAVNKPAGILTVYGDSKIQKKVGEYVKHVKENVSSQVLIEAKVVEIKLSDRYEAGVNWEWFNDDFRISQGKGADGTINIPATDGLDVSRIGADVFGGNLDVTVNLLNEFGTTKTLSSPRLATVNNQMANLSFTDKLIYFTTEVEEEDIQQGDGSTQVRKTFSTTKEEEEVGVELEIVPSINLETNEITMQVKPKLSVQVGTVIEPNPELAEAGITNEIPVIQKRSFETIMKIKSGETMVLGGLMQNNTENTETGIPGLMDIPLLGRLFKGIVREEVVTETVVFIKATILSSSGGVSDRDEDFYDKFNTEKETYF